MFFYGSTSRQLADNKPKFESNRAYRRIIRRFILLIFTLRKLILKFCLVTNRGKNSAMLIIYFQGVFSLFV